MAESDALASPMLRHFAARLCESEIQAQTLQHEIASVAVLTSARPTDASGLDEALESLLITVGLASRVPALQTQAKTWAENCATLAQTEAELKARLEREEKSRAQVDVALDQEKTQRGRGNA